MSVNNIYSIAKNPQKLSIIKTITWRVLATLITGTVVYLYTGELSKTGAMTLTAAVALTVGYYFHEKFWLRIVEKI